MASNSDYNITGKNLSFISPNMMSPGGEINPKLAEYFSLSESPWFHVVCGLLFLSTFVPQSRRLNRGLCYAIQVVAFLMGAVWVYTTHFGLTVFFVFFVMTSLSFVQTLYVLYHNKQVSDHLSETERIGSARYEKSCNNSSRFISFFESFYVIPLL